MAKSHTQTALSNIRRSPFQAMSATLVLTITFFVITTLSVVLYSSNQVLKYFETRPQVIAFLVDEATSEQISDLQSKLQTDMRVKEVTYVSKEVALEIYKDATSDNPLLSELVSPSIFPASLEFSVSDLSFAKELIDEIKQEEIVDRVGFTASLGSESELSDVVNRLRTITYYIKVGGGVFAGFHIGTSILVLLIIISIRMRSRKGEVEVLRLIGATPGFIRSPILIEAIIYALVGVLAGWALSLILFLYATPSILSYFGSIPILPRDTFELLQIFGAILVVQLVIGLILALSGSMLAVARVNRKK